MFKVKSLVLALAVAGAGITGAHAKCDTPPKTPTIKTVGSTLVITRNVLSNLEDATEKKDAKCVNTNRQMLTDIYLPTLKALQAQEVEPSAKIHTTPLIAAYESVLEPGLDLGELNKRIAAYFKATEDYRDYALRSEWKYSQDQDEMRGTISHYWTLNSTDTKKLDFPYKEARATILVMQKEHDGILDEPHAMIYVNDGQLSYSKFGDGEDMAVKFDDEEISTRSVRGCGDENQSVCFADSFSSLIFPVMLSVSNKAIIELDFYRAGREQYHFNTAGLLTFRETPDYMKKGAKK